VEEEGVEHFSTIEFVPGYISAVTGDAQWGLVNRFDGHFVVAFTAFHRVDSAAGQLAR